jgi:hypothetical protein
VLRHERPPRVLGRHADANPRAPFDRTRLDAAIFDVEAINQKIEPILRERNAHRHRQVAGTTAEIVIGAHGTDRPPAAACCQSVPRAVTPASSEDVH